MKSPMIFVFVFFALSIQLPLNGGWHFNVNDKETTDCKEEALNFQGNNSISADFYNNEVINIATDFQPFNGNGISGDERCPCNTTTSRKNECTVDMEVLNSREGIGSRRYTVNFTSTGDLTQVSICGSGCRTVIELPNNQFILGDCLDTADYYAIVRAIKDGAPKEQNICDCKKVRLELPEETISTVRFTETTSRVMEFWSHLRKDAKD